MAQPVAEKLMTRTHFSVRQQGATVVLTIGNYAVEMDHDAAYRTALNLWYFAKKARAFAGDSSRQIYGVAELTDAVADELEAQFNRDRTAAFWRGR